MNIYSLQAIATLTKNTECDDDKTDIFIKSTNIHHMILAPINKHMEDVNIKIQNTNIDRAFVTKLPGVMIDAQLSL